MRTNEIVAEVGFASELDLRAIDDNLLSANANIIGNIDGRDIAVFSVTDQELFLLLEDGRILGLVLVQDKKYLKGINSRVSKGGVITALIMFIVRKLKRSLVIDRNEGLTSQGLEWLHSIIKSGGRGLSFKDQNNSPVDPGALSKEWNKSFETDQNGPTEIIIEGKPINEGMFVTTTLMTTCRYIGDERNL